MPETTEEKGQIRVIVRTLEAVAEKVVKQITLDVTANLIETTPVDTGWARNNWVPKIGTPFEGITGEPGTTDAPGSSPGVQERGTAEVVTSYKLNQGRVYVSNNVPYIGALNDGHSKQAPAGFVQLAVLRALNMLEKANLTPQ